VTPASEPWKAEIAVSLDFARELIAAQFPSLALDSIEVLGEGWDNVAFLLDARYVFRFPRRAIAAQIIETEIAVLPQIAGRLPLPVSSPLMAGAASETYPWRFAGYPLLVGAPLSATCVGDAAMRGLAGELGAFLRALHAIDAAPLVEAGLPRDNIGRLDHAKRMPLLRARFEELGAARLVDDVALAIEFLESIAPNGPRESRLTIVHGDLYAPHVLVDGEGNATGIIDWGDVHFGDPAIDIAIAFEVLPPFARSAFAAAYGPIDDETWDLARYRAIYHAALVAHYGHRIGNAELRDAGLRGLAYSV
jgi:aminoglycoside phosphotransferase (APT) family kinase protein